MFAGFWLVVGVALLAYDFTTGKVNWKIDEGLHLPAWIAFGLAAFNLLRWRMDRTARAQQLEAYERDRQRHASLHQPRREEEEPNPDFDFKNPPPGAE